MKDSIQGGQEFSEGDPERAALLFAADYLDDCSASALFADDEAVFLAAAAKLRAAARPVDPVTGLTTVPYEEPAEPTTTFSEALAVVVARQPT